MQTLELTQPEIRKGDDWPHQLDAYHFAFNKKAAMLAMDMGTGKSRVAVNLVANWWCDSTLILCPKSVLGVWRREFSQHCGAKVHVIVLDSGTVQKKVERCEKQVRLHEARGDAFVVVINYESARALKFANWSLCRQWDCVILDESHRTKNPQSKIGKYVAKLAKRTRRRLCLTGTPLPHSPLDVFSQYRFLDENVFGWSYTRFRANYAVMHRVFPSQVIRWKNQDELQRKFSSIAFRVTSDVLDLPSANHHKISVELPEKMMEVYRELENQMIAQIDRGVITASNGLVKLLRLQQLTSGFAKADDEKEGTRIDRSKVTALNNLLITDIPEGSPVVVFCRFRSDIDGVREVAESWGKTFGEISGNHKDLTEHSKMPEGIDLMAVQIQSGGVGIDLTRSSHAVYMSVGYSLGDYEQSLARTLRPGQERDVNYYHLVCNETVDEAIYKALDERRDLVESVLDSLKERDGSL